jgi:acetyltransferase-like isoleucine patch superfamily enzyme
MDAAKREHYAINTYRHPGSFNVPIRYWMRFWMKFAGVSFFGRMAARFAALHVPPHKARPFLAHMNPRGYIAPSVTIYHSDLRLGKNIFIDERVVIFQRENAGPIEIGNRVYIYRDNILETGHGGYLKIGDDSSIHPRCQLNAYMSPITIGSGVMIAPNCALYSYDHGILPDRPIRKQPIQSKGPIVIEDEAWIGYGSIVLSGVRIGTGAVVGAGSVVTQDVPEYAIAAGVPATIVKMRNDIK